MPIDPSVAIGASTGTKTFTWNASDVLLYHLGIGAGSTPGDFLDPAALRYTLDDEHLQVLPSFGVVVPTFHGPVVICDVGANIAPQPRHLQQYAIMASAYGEAVCNMHNPRVGLLSIGEEDAKGTAIVKDSRKLMRDEPQINFIGNVEGRDLFKGVVDVVVCDGFVGNIILKFTEGITAGLFQTILAELDEFGGQAAVDSFKPVMKNIYTKHDWQEYGGAPLLGVGGYCLICHGASEARAIKNAIRVGQQLVHSGVNQKIVEKIAASIPGGE